MSKLIVLVVLVAVLGSVMCQYIETIDQPKYDPTKVTPLLLLRGGAFSGNYCVPPKVRVENQCVELLTRGSFDGTYCVPPKVRVGSMLAPEIHISPVKISTL
ncbi:hypothetical protein B5X24_HaOG210920 [Helicoverpa armigera]|uniref:Uncharacterized protein n=1 Tax=Helicoverpa armigera TaxID=29058 RepID=A0A2W1BLL6_HELAM|nr:hypothetical protein B5X24_HaOG210920 [Helicoverpa armigera]